MGLSVSLNGLAVAVNGPQRQQVSEHAPLEVELRFIALEAVNIRIAQLLPFGIAEGLVEVFMDQSHKIFMSDDRRRSAMTFKSFMNHLNSTIHRRLAGFTPGQRSAEVFKTMLEAILPIPLGFAA